jgi:uncharacterized phage protein (TIGR02218 family)
MAIPEQLQTHLDSGHTTLARCWQVVRNDGVVLGFTDHDRDVSFEGTVFKADTGLTAQVLEQSTGLSVDNSEALGALSDASISEADIAAGRFDGAAVTAWLVNWASVDDRVVLFRGSLGEIRRSGGAFQAELRGLTEPLNQPSGRVFQRACSAVLGDDACGFATATTGYEVEAEVLAVEDNRVVRVATLDGVDDGWFAKGRLDVLTGAAAGLFGVIKHDLQADHRVVALWAPLAADLAIGDQVRLQAGCDSGSIPVDLSSSITTISEAFPIFPARTG